MRNPLNEFAAPTPGTPSAPVSPSTLHRIFIGPDGLRAGWSILLFIVLFFVLGRAANFFAHATHLLPPPHAPGTVRPDPGPLAVIISEAIPFLVVALASWIMSLIERRPVGVYGLGGTRKLPHFLAGAFWGATLLSLLVLILWKTGLLIIDARLLFGTDVLRYAAAWIVGALVIGLLEEYLTRGYLQYTLTRGLAGFYRSALKARYSTALGFWSAAVIFSILFGLGHGSNPGESPIGLFSAGLAAMVFCLSLWRTGSLWWAVGFHAAWDWAQSFLYGVADSGTMVKFHLLATHPVGRPILSGGTTGPEGSIFVLPTLLLVALVIVFTLPRTNPLADEPVNPVPLKASSQDAQA
jgi:membrane protease YdiL (CAAX protease family)